MRTRIVSGIMLTLLLFVPMWYMLLVPSVVASEIEELDVVEHFEGTFGKEGYLYAKGVIMDVTGLDVWKIPMHIKEHVYVEDVKGDNVILRVDATMIGYDTGDTFPAPFSRNSTYVINKLTWENVRDAPEADKPREGYYPLYPSNLEAGEDIPNVWLDNLNCTATLEFVGVVEEEGLELYKYFVNETITKTLCVPGFEPCMHANCTLTSTKIVLIEPLSGGLPVYIEDETFDWIMTGRVTGLPRPFVYLTYRTAVLPNDVNDDGIVDILDVLIVALAFGSEPGDHNWNPIADLNQDGIVDIYDLVIVGVSFGKRFPL